MAKRKIWFGAAALGTFVALYIAYPYHTLQRLEDALETGDQVTLEALIDWPSLRDGLKDDLNTMATRALAEQAGPGGDPEAALGMGIAAMFMPVLVQRAVDAYVTPASIATLMRREAATGPAADDGPRADDWRFEVHRAYFAGPASFRFEFSNPDDPRPEPAIGVLALQGLRWRLTRLILPIEDLVPGAFGPSAPGAGAGQG
jgi:Protein of unknown function (DUF2939)